MHIIQDAKNTLENLIYKSTSISIYLVIVLAIILLLFLLHISKVDISDQNILINRIFATKNEILLVTADTVFARVQPSKILIFTDEQMQMLLMSETDIASGNLISDEELEIYN